MHGAGGPTVATTNGPEETLYIYIYSAVLGPGRQVTARPIYGVTNPLNLTKPASHALSLRRRIKALIATHALVVTYTSSCTVPRVST